jgi:hypothetical protein
VSRERLEWLETHRLELKLPPMAAFPGDFYLVIIPARARGTNVCESAHTARRIAIPKGCNSATREVFLLNVAL